MSKRIDQWNGQRWAEVVPNARTLTLDITVDIAKWSETMSQIRASLDSIMVQSMADARARIALALGVGTRRTRIVQEMAAHQRAADIARLKRRDVHRWSIPMDLAALAEALSCTLINTDDPPPGALDSERSSVDAWAAGVEALLREVNDVSLSREHISGSR